MALGYKKLGGAGGSLSEGYGGDWWLEYGADGEGEGAVVVEGHAVVAFGQGAP